MEKELGDKIFMIEDLETMRALADPLRVQVIELLVDRPHNARELAEKLGLAASRLYYHLNQLEKLGLIVVEETRQVGNLLEKTYRATAGQVEISRSLLNFQTEVGKESIATITVSTLDTTRDDLLRSLSARAEALARGVAEHPRHIVVTRATASLTEAQVEDFTNRLRALMADFHTVDENPEGTHPYALTLAFYPSFYYPPETTG